MYENSATFLLALAYFGLEIIAVPTDIIARYKMPYAKKIPSMPNAGIIALKSIEHNVEPKPKLTIDRDATSPLNFPLPNHKMLFSTGVTYPMPSAIPQQNPNPA